MAGVAPKRNVFLGKYFDDPTIKKLKKLKNKYPCMNFWPKSFTKVVTHVLYTMHFCDMNLITACMLVQEICPFEAGTVVQR
jgi:hypothetical protein